MLPMVLPMVLPMTHWQHFFSDPLPQTGGAPHGEQRPNVGRVNKCYAIFAAPLATKTGNLLRRNGFRCCQCFPGIGNIGNTPFRAPAAVLVSLPKPSPRGEGGAKRRMRGRPCRSAALRQGLSCFRPASHPGGADTPTVYRSRGRGIFAAACTTPADC